MPGPVSVEELRARVPMEESSELQLLFHRLNNQLGIILAHAELLEAKSGDEAKRVTVAGREQGLLLLSCGLYGNVIRLLPPLTATDEELERGLDILDACLTSR